ncbi:MAG: 23S rRNA (adenine(1618)-N(6))-methyltransferase RlmF [Saprospiraceae bacterium]|nr:23S rRNA (adenine(1618)-N(6))-methyltransferase RlmF [Saprospiraceae bacterium]
MSPDKKKTQKTELHPRNKNRGRYDLAALVKTHPALKNYVILNKYGDQSLDFSNPKAVKTLNQALLNHYYGIKNWDFPDQNLCPPIPGRADYIHYIADLLIASNLGKLPSGQKILGLDIGTGASCIYPILAATEYAWKFIASDINPSSIEAAKKIIYANPALHGKIECRLQKQPKHIFQQIIRSNEQIDFCICNPPFHASIAEAQKGSRRKVKNLSGQKSKTPQLNFSGSHHELVYRGGERQFIENMIQESKLFARNVFWFSTLVSKQANLKGIYKSLEKIKAHKVETIAMQTGNKSSRIVAWTFLSDREQKHWRKDRWK